MGRLFYSAAGAVYSRSERFQLRRSPSVVLLEEEEDDGDDEPDPFGVFSRSL